VKINKMSHRDFRLGTLYLCSRAVLVIWAIPGVLQVENNIYDVII